MVWPGRVTWDREISWEMGGDVEVCKNQVCKKGDDLWRSNMGMTVGALETLCCSKNRFYGFYIDANSGYLAIANLQNQKWNQTEEAWKMYRKPRINIHRDSYDNSNLIQVHSFQISWHQFFSTPKRSVAIDRFVCDLYRSQVGNETSRCLATRLGTWTLIATWIVGICGGF